MFTGANIFFVFLGGLLSCLWFGFKFCLKQERLIKLYCDGDEGGTRHDWTKWSEPKDKIIYFGDMDGFGNVDSTPVVVTYQFRVCENCNHYQEQRL